MKTLAAADKNSRDRQRQTQRQQKCRVKDTGKEVKINQIYAEKQVKIRCDLQDNQKAKDDKNRMLVGA